ncbi:MAG: hypothetical protein F2690_01470 [Actinobacteria bacterium]|uniref:Unannotated protein n=1 Tax=freshwater metagenome TaxID=449393 RepID=A0A6J5YRC2_9ZZZZ|nr:hypothetical protein [Actinomycetota bacterium]MSX71470.1 hypothetical protein [Actinomycetota bacterium]MSY69224.1 hypothetical protein [Actinomycetota bacterium]MTA75453.1 hypothetical protein [Actinomycetota bacterium]
MKRALLIAGGTLGGLGAVMAITPPQFSTSNTAGIGAGLGAIGGSTPAAASTPTVRSSATASATKSATSKPVVTKKSKTTKSATASATAQATAAATASATASATSSATPTATKTTAAPAPASKGVTGTFVGPSVYVNYGNVQVQITVKDGTITDAKAIQAPSGRSQRWTDMATPTLRKQTLAAQSDAIQGASGASYTSYGWYKSLQGALAKAGL